MRAGHGTGPVYRTSLLAKLVVLVAVKATLLDPSGIGLEMEAAALYAFARARGKAVVCFAHVTNQMGRIEQDFEKGEADGSVSFLAVIRRTAAILLPAVTTTG